MKWSRALAPVAVALVFAWLVSGHASCAPKSALDLIQVLDVAPRDVERGDRIAIVGAGFPAGKKARVTFRGVLHRPGEAPEANAEVAAWGVAVGPEQVEIAIDEPTEALFCGAGDRAVHTTFEGEVEVAFAAAVAGTPPIAGVLAGITLDVRPSATSAGLDRDGEGNRVLAFLGVRASPSGGGVGLRVDRVEPASRAQAAGLAAGDVLAIFDGVRVGSPADVIPFAGEREATVGVRHAGSANGIVRKIAVDGLRRAPPTELLGSALLIVAALALVLLFCAPNPNALQTLVAQAASRTRARLVAAGGGRTPSRAALSHALAFVVGDVVPPAGTRGLVDASAYAALAVMPLGQYVVAARLDVGILFLVAAVLLVGAALLTDLSAYRGAASALQIAWQHLPAAAAVASVVLMTGSLRVQEIERAQGGWPWDWLAFRSPAALVSLAMLLSAARLDRVSPSRRSGLAALVYAPASPLADEDGPYLRAAFRAHRILIAGLATVLFLGGWALPGLSPAQQDARPGMELLGDVWLLGKTGTLVVLVAWTRWALPAVPLAQGTRLTALWLLPLSALALGTTVAWTWFCPPRAEQLFISGSLVAVVVLVALAVAQRLRHGLIASTSDRRLSPFL